jgi:hypothetical protein
VDYQQILDTACGKARFASRNIANGNTFLNSIQASVAKRGAKKRLQYELDLVF